MIVTKQPSHYTFDILLKLGLASCAVLSNKTLSAFLELGMDVVVGVKVETTRS